MPRGVRNDPTVAPSAEDIIYAAGFTDGEGCITVRYSQRGTRRTAYASVTVSQADPHGRILLWFQERWGGAVRQKPEPKANARDAWEWCIVSKQAYVFLDDLLPWFRIKGPNAENALALRDLRRGHVGQELTDEEYEQRRDILEEARRLNKRGA